jgi:hypothetical protein
LISRTSAEDLRRLGRAAESLSYQERALEILRARTPAGAYELSSPDTQRASAAFGLARALDPHHPSSQRARELAQEALTLYTTFHAARDRAQVAAYLRRAAR